MSSARALCLWPGLGLRQRRSGQISAIVFRAADAFVVAVNDAKGDFGLPGDVCVRVQAVCEGSLVAPLGCRKCSKVRLNRDLAASRGGSRRRRWGRWEAWGHRRWQRGGRWRVWWPEGRRRRRCKRIRRAEDLWTAFAAVAVGPPSNAESDKRVIPPSLVVLTAVSVPLILLYLFAPFLLKGRALCVGQAV